MAEKAEAARASIDHAPQDHEYGLRQSYLTDPFGHHWQLQKKIG